MLSAGYLTVMTQDRTSSDVSYSLLFMELSILHRSDIVKKKTISFL